MSLSMAFKASLAGIAILAAGTYAVAQVMHDQHGAPGPGETMTQHGAMGPGMMGPGQMAEHGAMRPGMMAQHGAMRPGMMASAAPTSAGQDVFGAVQEIVRLLDADPNTDWTKVDLPSLREHLIDMHEVTLNAVADEKAIPAGLDIAITGEGRTLDAIRRMIPAHAGELNRLGLSASTEDLPNGVRLIVTTADAGEVARLEALGFLGIMTLGDHHQPHHLMIARGEFVH
jgi:hypothetical protein